MSDNKRQNLYASDIEPNDVITGSFLIKRKFLGIGKTGKSWLSLTLGDKTGEIDGRLWDNADEVNKKVEQGDFIMLDGIGTQYLDRVQLKITKWRLMAKSEINAVDYLPVSSTNQQSLLERLDVLLDSVEDKWVKALLQSYRADSWFMAQFCQAPAAKTVHHAFIGGLLEHTVSMMELADLVAGHYNRIGSGPVHHGILLAGTMLHDSGKIYELSTEPGFPYTDEGQMLGHIYSGMREMEKKADAIEGFPAELKLHLGHLILSHHGELEFGSGKRPKTAEAMILNAIDTMDSRLQIYVENVSRDGGRDNKEARWTSYVSVLDRYLLRKRYVSSEPANDSATGQSRDQE